MGIGSSRSCSSDVYQFQCRNVRIWIQYNDISVSARSDNKKLSLPYGSESGFEYRKSWIFCDPEAQFGLQSRNLPLKERFSIVNNVELAKKAYSMENLHRYTKSSVQKYCFLSFLVEITVNYGINEKKKLQAFQE